MIASQLHSGAAFISSTAAFCLTLRGERRGCTHTCLPVSQVEQRRRAQLHKDAAMAKRALVQVRAVPPSAPNTQACSERVSGERAVLTWHARHALHARHARHALHALH